MKKLISKAALLLAAALALPTSANAVPLVASASGNLVYDQDANLTWVKDMELFKTQAVSYTGGSGGTSAFIDRIVADWGSKTTPGNTPHTLTATDDFRKFSWTMSWYGALAWVNYLNETSYEGYNDWRLPTSDTCFGYGGGSPGCNSSEMGNLFINLLGDQVTTPVLTQTGDTDEQKANLALFSNVGNFPALWSSLEDQTYSTKAWYFDPSTGSQNSNFKDSNFRALALRDGAVPVTSPIPEPETYALMLAGLALVGAAARRRQAK
jgi:hypothetical protein